MSSTLPPGCVLREAAGPSDVAAARALFREYAAWLQEDLCFQGFDAELAALPGKYAPPDGRLFLVVDGGTPVGCAALRRHDGTTGEVKRLYVRDSHRGRGLGRALSSAVIAAGRTIGYRRLVLDTLAKMPAARRLYLATGFREIAPYYDNPIPGTTYLELSLAGSGAGEPGSA